MKDARCFWRSFSKNFGSTFERKVAHANQPFRLQRRHDFAQMLIAGREERFPFRRRKFVWRAIATALFHEGERAIVQDKVRREKSLGRAESIGEKFPESLAADFGTRAIETVDRALSMQIPGLADNCTYA